MTEHRNRDERVSLHGLDPEEALRALLAVKPDDEPASRDLQEDREQDADDVSDADRASQ